MSWTAKPGTLREAVGRFLAGQANPPAGVTLLGRWHSVDVNTGFSLYESSDPAAFYQTAAVWADLLDLNNHIVVEDAQAGPILAHTFAAQEPASV